jgi:hypothetical protein
MRDFEELKESLVKTCGFGCFLDKDNCSCFGVHNEEVRKEIGETLEEAIENAFYSMTECPHFEAMATPLEYIMSVPHEERLKNGLPPYYDLSPLKELK